jgi:class 3 adenylate cyclase
MSDATQFPQSQRKDATVLFADLSGFTEMSSALDPEEVREIVNRYFEALSAAVHRYDGTIDKYIGDCVMAVFGVPVAHADDAVRACRAALDMQGAVRDLASSVAGDAPEIHIGINTGLVVAAPMGAGNSAQFTVMGDAVNIASRLCHEAENGQTAVGESTWALANQQLEFGPKQLRSIKGKKEKVPVYFVTGIAQNAGRRRASVPLVGRARETATALDLLADVRNGHGVILHIAGEPGIGKSRFSADLSDWAEQKVFRVLSASANPLSAIDPYSLWRQILDQLIGVNPASGPAAAESSLMTFLESSTTLAAHAPVLRATLGMPVGEFELLNETARFERIGLGWTALLHDLQSRQPLLVSLDDLQWADPLSIQLLNQIVGSVSGSAWALVCVARTEFQPDWANLSYYHRINLPPLSAEDSATLVRQLLEDANMLGGADILGTAEGNPFYLTELAQAVAQRGTDHLPATITGLIQERIDRLEPRARQILEAASVIGREFPDRLLRALQESPDFESQLHCLRDLELIYEKDILPELLHLFKHHLTQETTYNCILIQRRKEMHRHVAKAIERVFKDDLERHYTALAQHYEKAAEYKRASEYYRLAGEKAQSTTSIEGAVHLYDRGEAALDMLHQERPELRNKIRAFILMPVIYLGLMSVLFLTRLINAEHRGTPLHPGRFLVGLIGGAVIMFLILTQFVFSATRWSFSVYPDRIRIRSKRRLLEIPFADITTVQVISYRHRPTPAVFWNKIKLNFDPRYPKYGMGQALGVLTGTRRYIRLDCRSAQFWRKGYCLDIDDPQSFLATLNRALERYRLIGQPFK